MSDRVTLTDYEARRLLNAIVKEFVQMTAEELEQQATEGNRYGTPGMEPLNLGGKNLQVLPDVT